MISSDFYTVYQSAGKKADGLVNLYCWAHLRRYFVRAGDANPVQLRHWTDAWLDRIRDLYAAHDELMAAWQEAAAPPAQGETGSRGPAGEGIRRLGRRDHRDRRDPEEAGDRPPAWQEPAKKALATLDREWDGLTAHRDYPMVGLDNYPDDAVMPMSVACGGPAAGQGGALAA